MKKRINKERKLKYANIITFAMSACFFILCGILIVIGISRDNLEPIILITTIFLSITMSTFIIPCFVSFLLEFITNPVINEGEETYNYLNKEEFIEVLYTPNINGCEKEMTLTILEKVNCNFFAKLNEEYDIFLIVKDKENNEIYNCVISNYAYFNSRFKVKSN